MNTAVRVKEPNGAWRQLSIGQAFVEASEYLKRGEDERALTMLEKVVQHAPSVPVFRYFLGIAQVRRKLYEPAITNLEKVVRSDERNVDYLVTLGEALITERPLEAIARLARAVQMGTKNPIAYSKLAEVLVDQRKPEEAYTICETGLAVCGPHLEILKSRGLALKVLGRSEEALACLRGIEALVPQDQGVLTNIAGALLDLNRVADARTYLERVLALDPSSASAHYNLGLALLLEGNYKDGFREYEYRWGIRQLVPGRPVFPRPMWDGSPLNGRPILLHGEQGAGDAIQFVRYAAAVKARGGRVILLVRQPLMRLLSWVEGCEVAALDAPLPPHDFHCPLLSLPLVMGTDLDSIPPPARFEVPAELKQKWSEILGPKTSLRVGIVWAGSPSNRNDRNRSLPCRLFAPLLEIPDIEWFSLQVGPPTAQLSAPELRGKIRDLAPDFANTAAAISQLDLVISVDTSVAHLAGSIGTTVWTLLSFTADWRWMLDREDTPWYPNMRLFRQKTQGDWRGVMESVAQALQSRPRTS
jgi:tetratricopeptide (TPR) repeat protein